MDAKHQQEKKAALSIDFDRSISMSCGKSNID